MMTIADNNIGRQQFFIQLCVAYSPFKYHMQNIVVIQWSAFCLPPESNIEPCDSRGRELRKTVSYSIARCIPCYCGIQCECRNIHEWLDGVGDWPSASSSPGPPADGHLVTVDCSLPPAHFTRRLNLPVQAVDIYRSSASTRWAVLTVALTVPPAVSECPPSCHWVSPHPVSECPPSCLCHVMCVWQSCVCVVRVAELCV